MLSALDRQRGGGAAALGGAALAVQSRPSDLVVARAARGRMFAAPRAAAGDGGTGNGGEAAVRNGDEAAAARAACLRLRGAP